MRKPVILFAIAIASLTSCKKKSCWKCTTTQTFSSNTGLSPIETDRTVCDMTRDDARDYERDHTSNTTTSIAGQPVTVNESTRCY